MYVQSWDVNPNRSILTVRHDHWISLVRDVVNTRWPSSRNPAPVPRPASANSSLPMKGNLFEFPGFLQSSVGHTESPSICTAMPRFVPCQELVYIVYTVCWLGLMDVGRDNMSDYFVAWTSVRPKSGFHRGHWKPERSGNLMGSTRCPQDAGRVSETSREPPFPRHDWFLYPSAFPLDCMLLGGGATFLASWTHSSWHTVRLHDAGWHN